MDLHGLITECYFNSLKTENPLTWKGLVTRLHDDYFEQMVSQISLTELH